ncbi:MAG: CotH kinase family protein, partial [Verrucomicrobiales bacterium]
VDTGLRMNGNFSRSKIQPKHNMRVVFREEYGPSRLEYELFEDARVTRFNSLIIRGLSGDSWAHARYPHAQYIRDQWFRDAHELMGYEGIRQREIQLYINGLYWGMYHIFERIEDDSMAERFGGVEEDWEVIKDGSNSSVVSIDNGTARWDALMDIIQAGGLAGAGPYAEVLEELDIDGFIDYLLLNYYGGNDDWCSKNYRAAVRLNPPGKWQFFPHDTERAGYNALNSAGLNKNSTGINNTYRPTHVHQELTANAEYRLRFADRAHRFLFNDGVLTEGPAGGLWSAKADLIREALKAECARWGDYTQDHRGASKINTLTEWQALVDREMSVWFPQRSAIVVEQLRARSLYPDIEAPEFNQHGGSVPVGFNLIFTNLGADAVYYTTDGSDPRLPGGAVNLTATNATSGNTPVTMISDSSPGWEFLDDGSDQGSSAIVAGQPGYDAGNWKHPDFSPATPWQSGTARLGYNASESTTVSFGPERSDKYPTTYFRRTFDLAGAALVSDLLLEVERDDGVVVYLNGHEVARDAVPDGAVHFDTLASESASGAEEATFYPFALDASALVEGRNVLAIEVHQVDSGSSDLSIDARLSGTMAAEGSAVPIDGQTIIKARAYNVQTQEWSALAEASFTTGRAPVPGDLAVSELHYHPADPTPSESSQPFIASESDFEFLELMNLSADTLDLSGLSFSDGIDFAFPDETPLVDPRERILVVNNRAAFEFRYASSLPLPIAGEFGSTSSLSNNGERITLSSGALDLIDFSYGDMAPWPVGADGDGYSLVLIRPSDHPDLSVPANWRTSAAAEGAPGASDTITLDGFMAANNIADPFADHDSDGIATIIEIATGTPFDAPSSPGPLTGRLENIAGSEHIVIEFPTQAGMDDIRLEPEASSDLASWDAGGEGFVYLGETRAAAGDHSVRRFRSSAPIVAGSAWFARLRASRR